MKKIISVVLCFVLAVSLGASCFADAIAVYPDKFYEEHVSEFERTSLHCICASGSTAQKNPKSPIPAFDLKDNFSYAVFDKYTDDNGVVWAHIIEDNNPYYDAKHGWIPMTSLRRVYGGNEFYNDHSDEYIYPESEEERIYADLSKGAVVYMFPGSAEKSVVNAGVFAESIYCRESWVDENGYVWVNVFPIDAKGEWGVYLPGMDRFWVCLDNPLAGYELAPNADTAEVIFDPDAPKIEGIAAYGEYEYLDDSVPVPYAPPFGKYLFTAIGITLAVAVGAVVLAVVLKKKK